MKKSDKSEAKAFQYEALALQVRGTSFAEILCDDERELAPILRDLRNQRRQHERDDRRAVRLYSAMKLHEALHGCNLAIIQKDVMAYWHHSLMVPVWRDMLKLELTSLLKLRVEDLRHKLFSDSQL